MPNGVEPSPLQLSGKRMRNQKLGSNYQLNECPYPFSDDNNCESVDEEEYEIAADKNNFIRRIRKEMFCRKKRTLKTVRLSNDFLNKKAKNSEFEEESAFYNKLQQDDEYQEGDELVLAMGDMDDDGNQGDNDGGDGFDESDEEDDDNFGILGVLNKKAKQVM